MNRSLLLIFMNRSLLLMFLEGYWCSEFLNLLETDLEGEVTRYRSFCNKHVKISHERLYDIVIIYSKIELQTIGRLMWRVPEIWWGGVVCQLSTYCLSALNLPSLPCLWYWYFSLASWPSVKLFQLRGQEGHSRRKGVLLHFLLWSSSYWLLWHQTGMQSTQWRKHIWGSLPAGS